MSAVDAQHALLVRKVAGQGTQTRRRLRDAIQIVVPNSTHQMEQLFTLSNSSQVLFADRALLAEGKTELRLVPCIYEALRGKTLGQDKSALVAQSGVNDTKKSMDILAAMDIPCKAIVDLDYAFSGAVKDDFLPSTDVDLQYLKTVLTRLAAAGKITLNSTTGLPQKGVVRAAEAFALLALEPDATAPIAALHAKLLSQNIWLWKRGAIEAHIGTTEKSESEWTKFQIAVATSGFPGLCPDQQSVEEMIAWAAS